MPHIYKGVTFPLYQEPETKTVGRPAAPIPQRALTKTQLNWPPEALPFAYAIACIDIVSQHSREASVAYYEAIEALELPGCQALIKMAKIQAPDTNTWSSKTIKKLLEKGIKSLEKGKDILSLPWLTATEQYKDDADYLHFIESIREFIRIGFNRQIDRENERYKVLAEKAPFLFMAVVFRTIAEYCKVKLENWNKYRTDDIDRMMNSNPTKRQERLKKKEIKQTYKRFKWALLHNVKLLKYADFWYKSRVNPGNIEQYLSDLANQNPPIILERCRVENDIAACDEATGYPRKWRK